ncbi:urocanate hydratase [Terriglobus albidus]|uniref:Urocanate hydratase n=1 Tax=Terriglobus albidus TaxID=1592106 RepID=A0A5B9EIH1_9BACT|nr:urocanate hydratase [Terriglobus albidus]QEE29906.1 urocanate hydratase [Terriglobus albidus]
MVDRQLSAWRLYGALRAHRSDWGGSILIHRGVDDLGSALAVAANLCGAVCLSVEADPAQARVAMRGGYCDFLVNTLDEALRTMKNEVRKRRPLTVVLEGNTSAILKEIGERGVYPQLLVTRSAEDAIPAERTENLVHLLESGETVAAQPGWIPCRLTAGSNADLRFAEQATAGLITDGDARRGWVVGAPKFFRREQPPRRYLWLTEQERDAMTAVLPAGVTIEPLSHPAS